MGGQTSGSSSAESAKCSIGRISPGQRGAAAGTDFLGRSSKSRVVWRVRTSRSVRPPLAGFFPREHGGVNPRVDRLNLETGERHHLREIRPVNSTGVVSTTAPVMTPDGKRYAFTLIRRLTDPFLVEGLDA
jgi:hypothetical protein